MSLFGANLELVTSSADSPKKMMKELTEWIFTEIEAEDMNNIWFQQNGSNISKSNNQKIL